MPAALLAAARRVRARRSVIIGGHGVARVAVGHDPEHLCVEPGRFRAQLELLLQAGFEVVPLGELARRAAGGTPPPGLAALTFDDGMENTLSVLAPILREYGLPATVFVVSGLLGQPNPWMDPRARARMLTADELVELHGAGVEIGAHTVTHPDLSVLPAEACLREVQGSRDTLQDAIAAPVTSFAYPFFAHGPAAVAAVQAAGFGVAVAGAERGPWRPLALPRAMITGVDGPAAFVAKLAGAYDPAFHSRPGRLARALTRGARTYARSRR